MIAIGPAGFMQAPRNTDRRTFAEIAAQDAADLRRFPYEVVGPLVGDNPIYLSNWKDAQRFQKDLNREKSGHLARKR